MSPDAGRTWFRVAVFIVLVSAALLFVQQPGTAEFVITVASLVVGLLFILAIAIAVRRG